LATTHLPFQFVRSVIGLGGALEMAGKSSEALGVEPVFLKERQAINYAQNLASFR
jgi:hypothetical protein